MNTWIITDTHFGHRKIVEEFKERPEGFEEKFLKNCAKEIKEGDTIIHLGDFSLAKGDKNDKYWHERFIKEVPGRKILVRGNHDGHSDVWYEKLGWDFVCKYFVRKYFGYKIFFTHRPKEKLKFTDINIHGHLHGDYFIHEDEHGDFYDEKYNIAIDNNEYKPILLKHILENQK